MSSNMVARNRLDWQGLGQHSPFMPLSLIEIQQLIAHSNTTHAQRLVYALLVLHADCMGNVVAKVPDIARLAGYSEQRARGILRELVRGGHITRKVPGVGRRLTCWHVSAVRDAA